MNVTREHHQWLNYLFFALPFFVAFLLYGYTLRLPFFLDDGAHFDILASTSGLEYWGDFPSFPFYRPFVFTLWQTYDTVTGGYDPVALHWVNVACFGLAGVLCGQVVRNLSPFRIRRSAAVVAGILFVIFPFSYQAVAMVAALFHLTLALGVLLSTWAGLRYLVKPDRFNLLLAWIGAFIAIFSHENGVLLLPLLIGAFALKNRLHQWRRIVTVLAPITVMVAVYLWQWWQARPQDATQINNAIEVSGAVLVQGLAYPVVSLLRPLAQGDAEPLVVIMLVGVTVLLVVGICVRFFTKSTLPLLYGMGWYLLAILPATIFLTASYVLGQTRLALFASVGGSIFWAIMIASLWADKFRVAKLLAMFVMLIFVYVSVEFLAMRRADFLRLAEYQAQLIAQFEALDLEGENTVVVNAPDYLIPSETNRRFLIGTEGVLFVDPAANYGLQWTINAAQNYRDVNVFAFPAIQRNSGFGFSAHPPALGPDEVVAQVQDAGYVFVTEFQEQDFEAVLVGGGALSVPENEIAATLGGGAFELIAGHVHYNSNYIEVRSQWQVNTPRGVKLFIHAYCDDEFVGQSDGYPWGDTYPFSYWSEGERQTDVRRIYVDNTIVTPACLRVYAGLYNETDVTRLDAFENELRFENDQIPIGIISED